MDICIGYENIPQSIVEKLVDAPLFYSSSYYENIKFRKQKAIYIWSDTAIMMARVKTVLIMKAALLECEPYFFTGKQNDDYRQFLDEAMGLLKKIGVQWTITTNTARFQSYPSNAKVIRSGNYIMDLTLTEEDLWSRMHSKHRNAVRRGEKAEMSLCFGGQELAVIYTNISRETYERSGMKESSSDYYRSLMQCLDDKSIIGIVEKDQRTQAAGMFLYSSAMGYYLHGASTTHPEPGSTNYLLWRSIILMKEKGVKKFSFVGYHVDAEQGSKLYGIQKFKERFGGELELCYSFKYIHNKFMYGVYCFAMRILSGDLHKKYFDAIDAQVKHFPELNKKAK